jgi:hypothetical protein
MGRVGFCPSCTKEKNMTEMNLNPERIAEVEAAVGAKRPWATPYVSRISAGSAENADQPGSDDGINLAS